MKVVARRFGSLCILKPMLTAATGATSNLYKQQFGGEPGGITPDQFAGFIKSETAKRARVVKESKATVD